MLNFPALNFAGLNLSTWFVFGWLNIIVAKLLFIFLATRRGLSLSTAIALGLSYTIGAAVGTVVLYSITGTIAGIILFFFLGVYLLRIKEPPGDLPAMVIAVALGIGRLGCLISGISLYSIIVGQYQSICRFKDGREIDPILY